jgi:hypothetical protein
MSRATESILAGQVRAARGATGPDDIVSALHAARPGDRGELLSLRGAAMLREVARACGVSCADTMTKPAAIAAIVESF